MATSLPNHRSLLCVDDDAGIRQFYETLFGTYGYDVLSAASAGEALTVLRSHGDEFDAVVCDFEMPGMNGYQLAAEVKRLNPGMPILLLSGYPAAVDDAPEYIDAALQKGASIAVIIEKIDLLLASHRHAELAAARYMPAS